MGQEERLICLERSRFVVSVYLGKSLEGEAS